MVITLRPTYNEFVYYEHPAFMSKFFSSEKNTSDWHQRLKSSDTIFTITASTFLLLFVSVNPVYWTIKF